MLKAPSPSFRPQPRFGLSLVSLKIVLEESSNQKCCSKALANSIGFGDRACYSNLTELPGTTALCSGFKTQEG